MHQTKRIIVVGGNAAGPSAAAKAKRVNPNADLILFEAGKYISTGTCELPYLISGEIDDYNKLVFFNPESFYKEKGVRVYNNHIVNKIDIKYKELSVINSETNTLNNFEYDKLILTTGSKAREIKKLPFSLENVFGLKSVNDYVRINEYISNNSPSNVLVIGSGYIGLEVADSFKNIGLNVSILEQEQNPMPASDIEIQHLILELLQKAKINFLSSEHRTDYVIKNNKLSQLKINGRFIDFDLVIVAIGVQPNNRIAEEAGLKLGMFGGLNVDGRLRTSNPDIYAAGDNIEIRNFINGQNDYLPLATHAHSYGHVAGENAAGGNKIVKPVILNSAFKICGKFIAQVGLSQRQAESYSVNSRFVTAVTNNKVKVMPSSSKVFGKVIYDKSTCQILGASFVGSEEVSGYANLISAMIYNKNSVRNLSKLNFNYTPPLSPFINLVSILGRKIEESY